MKQSKIPQVKTSGYLWAEVVSWRGPQESSSNVLDLHINAGNWCVNLVNIHRSVHCIFGHCLLANYTFIFKSFQNKICIFFFSF